MQSEVLPHTETDAAAIAAKLMEHDDIVEWMVNQVIERLTERGNLDVLAESITERIIESDAFTKRLTKAVVTEIAIQCD